MWLHKILILSIALQQISAVVLVDVIKSVAEHAFAGRHNFLYFRDFHLENLYHHIDVALMGFQDKARIVVNSESPTKSFYKYTAHALALSPDNISNYQNLLDYIPEHVLAENIRVLVFSEENYKNYIDEVEEFYPLGAEIVFVSVPTGNRTFLKEEPPSYVCVYLAWKKKSLCVSSNSRSNWKKLVAGVFKEEPWKPIPQQAITVQAFNCPPFVQYDEHQKKYSGIEYNILREVTKNWQVNLKIINDSHTSDASQWKSAIDAVLEGRADMAMCSLWLNLILDLAPDTSIIYPFLHTCVTLLVPKPQLLPDVSFVFQPAQFGVWLLLILLVPAMSLFLGGLSRFTSTKEEAPASPFSDAFVNTIRTLTVGSLARFPPPSRCVMRFILVAFSLTCLLFSTVYSAGFMCHFTYPRLENPITKLKDVVEMKIKIDADIPDLDGLARFFKKFENPYVQQMSDLLVSSVLKEYKSVETKDFARIVKLIGEKYVSDTETFDNYKKTHLRLLKECLLEPYNTFSFRGHSRYTAFFNKKLVKLNEHGFITYWYRQSTTHSRFSYMSNFFSSYVYQSFEHVRIPVRKLFGAFLLLTIGLASSLIVFFYEMCKSERVSLGGK